jgi:hypothetical protein
MIKKYRKTSLRNILKNRVFSTMLYKAKNEKLFFTINITGITMAMAACITITAYVNHHKKAVPSINKMDHFYQTGKFRKSIPDEFYDNNNYIYDHSGHDRFKNFKDKSVFIITIFKPSKNIPITYNQVVFRLVLYSFILLSLVFIINAWVNYIKFSYVRYNRHKNTEPGSGKINIQSNRLSIKLVKHCLVFSAFAIILALMLVHGMSEYISQKTVYTINLQFSVQLIVALFSTFFLGIILSIFYPTWLLNSHKQIKTLQGKLWFSKKEIKYHKTLIMIQLITAIFLIVGSLEAFDQHSLKKITKFEKKVNKVALNQSDSFCNRISYIITENRSIVHYQTKNKILR